MTKAHVGCVGSSCRRRAPSDANMPFLVRVVKVVGLLSCRFPKKRHKYNIARPFLIIVFTFSGFQRCSCPLPMTPHKMAIPVVFKFSLFPMSPYTRASVCAAASALPFFTFVSQPRPEASNELSFVVPLVGTEFNIT